MIEDFLFRLYYYNRFQRGAHELHKISRTPTPTETTSYPSHMPYVPRRF